ncbi:MAG TPA: class I SAM-dependent methyltransferase [Stellaceae bacterium]|nr:class I SAM-dependent methyltransferase [Stellaceae bacterium]
MSGWDDPATPVYYEAFCRAHDRYARANAALIGHAGIAPGMRVLDLAAGTGRTAEAALARIGDGGRILCVEPAAAMRAMGQRRLGDPRVAWCERLTEAAGPFDRILCGAAIWQMTPLDATIRDLSRLLAPGGALCFNIPALYLCEPDEPGGGDDPLLLALPARLAAEAAGESETAAPSPPLARGAIDAWLEEAGLRARSWTFRIPLTQAAYAEWLKIPVVNGRMLAGLAPEERARRIDATLAAVDATGWKWERWRGWTAWKS